MIKPLTIGELTEQDLLHLDAAVSTSYTGRSVAHILTAVAQQHMDLWRLGDGVLVTQLLDHPAGHELYLWALAGQGLVHDLEQHAEELCDIARRANCRWIGGLAVRPGLVRVLIRRLKVVPKYTYCLLEVDNGRK